MPRCQAPDLPPQEGGRAGSNAIRRSAAALHLTAWPAWLGLQCMPAWGPCLARGCGHRRHPAQAAVFKDASAHRLSRRGAGAGWGDSAQVVLPAAVGPLAGRPRAGRRGPLGPGLPRCRGQMRRQAAGRRPLVQPPRAFARRQSPACPAPALDPFRPGPACTRPAQRQPPPPPHHHTTHLTKESPPATQKWVLPGRQCTLLSSSRPRCVRQASRRRLAAPGSRKSKCRTWGGGRGGGQSGEVGRQLL